jgi:hypothetical protein
MIHHRRPEKSTMRADLLNLKAVVVFREKHNSWIAGVVQPSTVTRSNQACMQPVRALLVGGLEDEVGRVGERTRKSEPARGAGSGLNISMLDNMCSVTWWSFGVSSSRRRAAGESLRHMAPHRRGPRL